MTTDRELLELAAKAAGIERGADRIDGGLSLTENGGHRSLPQWNPLTDDGDALRLAVKLCLSTRFDTLSDGPIACAAAEWHEEFAGYWWNEWLKDDPCAALRRAVVRAAAELGKMK